MYIYVYTLHPCIFRHVKECMHGLQELNQCKQLPNLMEPTSQHRTRSLHDSPACMHGDRISIHPSLVLALPPGWRAREIRCCAALHPGPVPGRRAHLGRSIDALHARCAVSRFVVAGRRMLCRPASCGVVASSTRRRRRRPRAGF